MPVIHCPVSTCQFATDDVSDELAVTLLKLHAHDHTAQTTNNSTSARMEKVKRPVVSTAGSSEDWTYFLSRWSDFKTATKVTGRDAVIQLLECCEEQLRKDITRNAGGSLTSKSEDEVLAAIKTLAVREENSMVARMQLHNMKQDRDETVRSFGARLRGQAGVCKYSTECPNCNAEVNFTDIILRDALTRGISDPDIQLDLLSDRNQDMTLEEAFKFVEAKEAGKRSASQIHESSQGAGLGQSKYRRNKRQTNVPPSTPANEKCGYCGQTGHGSKAPPNSRRRVCPAFSHTCGHCTLRGHYDHLCRKKDSINNQKQPPPKTDSADNDESGGLFNALCGLSDSSCYSARSHKQTLSLDHHVYDNMCDQWLRQASKPQPYVSVSARVCSSDYEDLGIDPAPLAKPVVLSAMADTGCQSCLAGIKVLHRLGLTRQDLIPVTMKMHAANNGGINIIGGLIVRYTGTSTSGTSLETRQITYITDNSDKLFLSREACIALGVISDKFPQIGEAVPASVPPVPQAATSESDHPKELAPCGCLKRTSPPPQPSELPYPPTEENRDKLQSFLLDYYASSTFNTCPHQPLTLMDVPPMRLMVDPNATPIAHHKAIPVPLHWQDEVKASLDRDVQLGVLEPVPVGEPVTWCHRMVVCSKKDGSSRRTVDFQALNKHATRETHHTQSPFHQARSVPQGKKKTVFDAWNGYHSVPLHADDRHLTTFITPWGRYRYCVAPQGYISSGDAYTRRYDELVAEIPNKTKCVEDALLWSDIIIIIIISSLYYPAVWTYDSVSAS